MGIRDRIKSFFSGNSNQQSENQPEEYKYPVTYKEYKDNNTGRDMIYFEAKVQLKSGMEYDTIKCIVDKQKQGFSGEETGNAKKLYSLNDLYIKWHRTGDAHMVSEPWTAVRTTIDIERIKQQDPTYCAYLFGHQNEGLLGKNRVNYSLMEQDFSPDPSQHCGNYIGHLKNLPDGTVDFDYDRQLANTIHNLPDQIQRRQTIIDNQRDFLNNQRQMLYENQKYIKNNIDSVENELYDL